MIRVFSKHGNRKNKNKARLKFVVRERGFDWVREQIEKEYQDILANGGIPTPEVVPEGFGGFQSSPPPLGRWHRCLPIVQTNGHSNPAYERWLETNVRQQKQNGYAMVTVKVPQGNLTGGADAGLGQSRAECRRRTVAGRPSIRISCSLTSRCAICRRSTLPSKGLDWRALARRRSTTSPLVREHTVATWRSRNR